MQWYYACEMPTNVIKDIFGPSAEIEGVLPMQSPELTILLSIVKIYIQSIYDTKNLKCEQPFQGHMQLHRLG